MFKGVLGPSLDEKRPKTETKIEILVSQYKSYSVEHAPSAFWKIPLLGQPLPEPRWSRGGYGQPFPICYATVVPGRKSGFRAGFRPDSSRASLKPALRPAEGGLFQGFPDSNLAEIRTGGLISGLASTIAEGWGGRT